MFWFLFFRSFVSRAGLAQFNFSFLSVTRCAYINVGRNEISSKRNNNEMKNLSRYPMTDTSERETHYGLISEINCPDKAFSHLLSLPSLSPPFFFHSREKKPISFIRKRCLFRLKTCLFPSKMSVNLHQKKKANQCVRLWPFLLLSSLDRPHMFPIIKCVNKTSVIH